MAALGSMVFEVLLKPASGEAMVVGEFTVDLEHEVPDTDELTVQVHMDRELIAQGLREVAQGVSQAEEEGA